MEGVPTAVVAGDGGERVAVQVQRGAGARGAIRGGTAVGRGPMLAAVGRLRKLMERAKNWEGERRYRGGGASGRGLGVAGTERATGVISSEAIGCGWQALEHCSKHAAR